MPEDCCRISSPDCLPMPTIFEGKQSHQCHRVEDVESLPSISFPGFSTIIITSPLPRTCGLIALGEWLRADVVSALSFKTGAGRSSQLLRAATMSFCFLPVSNRRGACRHQWRPGPRAGGDEAIEKGPPSQTSDEEAATN